MLFVFRAFHGGFLSIVVHLQSRVGVRVLCCQASKLLVGSSWCLLEALWRPFAAVLRSVERLKAGQHTGDSRSEAPREGRT